MRIAGKHVSGFRKSGARFSMVVQNKSKIMRITMNTHLKTAPLINQFIAAITRNFCLVF